MSYRNDFLKAFLARKKYIPDAATEKYFSYKDLLSFNAKKDFSDAYKCYKIMENVFLNYYMPLRERNKLPIAHSCHVIAFDMLQLMIKNKYCDPRDLAYTVGNISVEGQWPYDENLRWILDYKPMLVDPDFCHRVDVMKEIHFQ